MSLAIKVGIFATAVLLMLGYFVLSIEDLELFGEEGVTVDAIFDSVAGLNDRSAVRVAGVKVGRVDGVELAGRQAITHLRLDQELGLTEGTFARIASLGMLGDKYIELVPGPPDAPPLPPDAVIPGVTPPDFDDAMAKINEVADSVVGFTDPLAESMAGDGAGTSLSRLIENLEATSFQVRLLVEANREQLGQTIGNFQDVSATLARELPRLADRLEGLLGEVQAVVAENRGDVGRSTANVAEITDELKTSVADLNTITGRLARGEGTMGKLLASEEAHEELVTTLDSIQGGVGQLADTLGRVQRLRLDVDLDGWVPGDSERDSYGGVGLTLFPTEDSRRMYRVGLAQTPGGEQSTTTQVITETGPGGVAETRTIETVTRDDEAVISALVGYRWDSGLRVWTGLVEEDFGFQVEYPFLERRLWVDVKAFDFDRDEDLDPHLRLTGKWYFNDNVYIQGGYDDPLVDEFDSLFLGGGIRWTDDDLKYLLGSVPAGAF